MGIMDDMQDKFGGGTDMRDRYDQLCQMEEQGTLDDQGREELMQLREHFDKD